MAKCYLTGIEIPTEESFLLNIGVANRAIKDLRSKPGTLERLLSQLGPKDEVDIYSVGEGEKSLAGIVGWCANPWPILWRRLYRTVVFSCPGMNTGNNAKIGFRANNRKPIGIIRNPTKKIRSRPPKREVMLLWSRKGKKTENPFQ